ERPTSSPRVKTLLTMRCPNGVPLLYSASRWMAAGFMVRALNSRLSVSGTVRRTRCSKRCPTLKSAKYSPATCASADAVAKCCIGSNPQKEVHPTRRYLGTRPATPIVDAAMYRYDELDQAFVEQRVAE